jgi:hypothetical protein
MSKTKKRARGSCPTRTTITMTKLDKERLELLRDSLKGADGRKLSGSLALSEVVRRYLLGGAR